MNKWNINLDNAIANTDIFENVSFDNISDSPYWVPNGSNYWWGASDAYLTKVKTSKLDKIALVKFRKLYKDLESHDKRRVISTYESVGPDGFESEFTAPPDSIGLSLPSVSLPDWKPGKYIEKGKDTYEDFKDWSPGKYLEGMVDWIGQGVGRFVLFGGLITVGLLIIPIITFNLVDGSMIIKDAMEGKW